MADRDRRGVTGRIDGQTAFPGRLMCQCPGAASTPINCTRPPLVHRTMLFVQRALTGRTRTKPMRPVVTNHRHPHVALTKQYAALA
jgi:hypothetical protein